MEKNTIITTKHTFIEHECDPNACVPRFFEVKNNEDVIVGMVDFQLGSIEEKGINGVRDEDLLHILKVRLESFKANLDNCEDTNEALNHIYRAIISLNKRAQKRILEGTDETDVI